MQRVEDVVLKSTAAAVTGQSYDQMVSAQDRSFEYLFTFYGLLLGLAAANVATGFADMWRDRREIAVGVCAPLVAVIVLLGAMNLWLSFRGAQEAATLDGWRVISVAGIALPYVFIRRAMFPGVGTPIWR